MALERQLRQAGVAEPDAPPPAPWFPIQGPRDATTLWYTVMRKATRGIVIGALCLRHSDHHDLLRRQGWEDVPLEEIGLGLGLEPEPRVRSPI